MCLCSSTFKQKWTDFMQHIAQLLTRLLLSHTRPLVHFVFNPCFSLFNVTVPSHNLPSDLLWMASRGWYTSLGRRGSGRSLKNSLRMVATSCTLTSSVRITSAPLSKSSRSWNTGRGQYVDSVQWGINAAPGALASDWFPPWRCPRCWGRAAPGIYKHLMVTRNPQASIYWT